MLINSIFSTEKFFLVKMTHLSFDNGEQTTLC